MINIVIPMAGKGSRFVNAGYVDPKPLIKVGKNTMIECVIKNIMPNKKHKFIFICQKEHLNKYHLEDMLKKISLDCEIIPINYITEGAACTVLLAEKFIDNDSELMIANSDQYIDYDINEYIELIKDNDGIIMTMPGVDSKWSYIKYNKEGYVTLVREKEVISNEATVGIYNFKKGSDFVKYAKKMISKNIRANNEFYVAPVYNEMILDNKKIIYKNIGNKMHGLGTPQDLDKFINTKVFRKLNEEFKD